MTVTPAERNGMIKRIAVILASSALVLGLGVTMATSAQASTAWTAWVDCTMVPDVTHHANVRWLIETSGSVKRLRQFQYDPNGSGWAPNRVNVWETYGGAVQSGGLANYGTGNANGATWTSPLFTTPWLGTTHTRTAKAQLLDTDGIDDLCGASKNF